MWEEVGQESPGRLPWRNQCRVCVCVCQVQEGKGAGGTHSPRRKGFSVEGKAAEAETATASPALFSG